MIVCDKDVSLILSGTGDVVEPEDGVVAIGSGGNYALADRNDLNAEEIVTKAMKIAADICVYTNENLVLEKI